MNALAPLAKYASGAALFHAIRERALPRAGEKVLLVCRHGESLHNILGSIPDRSPDRTNPLTPDGELQAQVLHVALQPILHLVGGIFTSPVWRAAQTSTIARGGQTSLPIIERDDLRDFYAGDLAGMPERVLFDGPYGETWKHCRETLALPNGETYKAFMARVRTEIQAIETELFKRPEDVFILVTHLEFIINLTYLYTAGRVWYKGKKQFGNASLSGFLLKQGGKRIIPSCLLLGDQSHLIAS